MKGLKDIFFFFHWAAPKLKEQMPQLWDDIDRWVSDAAAIAVFCVVAVTCGTLGKK